MTQDKLLDKLRKLKAHADSAEKIGNEAEAQAFAAMFQKLLLDHKLEMSDVEFAEMEKTDAVEKHFIDYNEHGIPVKRSRVQWQERLASVIAHAHFCRILVYPGSNRLSLIGRKDDIAVAEYMIVTLFRATESLAKKEHMKYCWEVYKRDGNCRAAQGFKMAFIQSFIMRLAQRYDEAKRAAEAQCVALVRLDTAVEDWLKAMRDGKGPAKAHALARMYSHNGEGHRRGQRAADNISLTPNALGGQDVKKLK